jgi:CRISPR-associated protein (TIGR03986 family)
MATRRPVHSNPKRPNRIARAPYNFVPLPETIVTLDESDLPSHDRYQDGTSTGWFDCELETCSPTYVRGMMTTEQAEKHDPEAERLLSKEEQVKLKEERAPFYSASEEKVGTHAIPMIPGSSLRGLIRSVVEIAGYGKMQWVNKAPKVTFRAVAAPREDPLAEPYRSLIGSFSRNVLAGYLEKTERGWRIRPALKPKAMNWPERAAYLKVREDSIPSVVIKDFVRLSDPKYWPEWYPVSFSISTRRGKAGPYVRVDMIGDELAGYPHKGVLVCTGNMIESLPLDRVSRRKQIVDSPRRNHTLVLSRDPKAQPLTISEELLRDYLDSLTPFQRDELWQPGGLEHDAPVFYVLERGRLVWFGHTPNFRVPALNRNGNPATPVDFIPDDILFNEAPDLAEAIFGWVAEGAREGGRKNKQRDRSEYAGRVFFTDGEWIKEDKDVWYAPHPVAPATLGGPKIATFQHYLVQDRERGHDPEFRQTLAHYASEPDETEIRGHKLYWHKGNVPVPEAISDEKESQLTRINPVKPGVRFTFRIYVENLRAYEIGALAWALQLPGKSGSIYHHKLGMGKPLGMGTVAITAARLQITERHSPRAGRYGRLFENGRLATGAHPVDSSEFIAAFERHVLEKVAPGKQHLYEVDRIQMLLAMLKSREATPDWLERTRYLSIRHPQRDNEYDERPVLPDPLAVSAESPMGQNGEKLLKRESSGQIARIPKGRSFGYIKPDDEPTEIFFHFSQLAKGSESVQPEERVTFKTRTGQRGIEAYDVRLSK